MKIAVFSDIHGNYEALESIYNDCKKNNIDEIIFLGDAIGLGPQPIKCLDFIMDHDITMVLGNHEERQMKESNVDYHAVGNGHHLWVHKQMKKKHIDFISKLPIYIEREYNGKKFIFAHFFLKSMKHNNLYYPVEIINDKEELKKIKDKMKWDYIFVGHHHYFYEYKDLGVVDVGPSGCVYDNKTHYYIINIDKDITYEKKIIEYDRKSFEKSFKEVLNTYDNEHNLSMRFFGVKL